MQLSDAKLNRFVELVLKLDHGKRKEFLEQVDHLIAVMTAKINSESDFSVKEFIKAGSLQKGTVLRPRGDHGVDADIAVALDVSEADRYDIERLHAILRELLILVYPQKVPGDFTMQPRTLGIVFRVSGLEVDLVPIIPIPSEPGYSWQPSAGGDEPIKTNIRAQLKFIKGTSDGDARYRSLVRMGKNWRNHKELGSLRSFTIELVLAHLQREHGTAPSLEEGIMRFFLYLAQSELQEPIRFDEPSAVVTAFADPVVIVDPVNTENNVARRVTLSERLEITKAAEAAWETLSVASTSATEGQTNDLWKEVMGRSFRTEE